MKNTKKLLGIIALAAMIGFGFNACDDGGGGNNGDPELTGTITIDKSSAATGEELTATYSGSETVSFQWKKDGTNVGTSSTTNPNKYTPAEAGSYTVIINATGYQSKTSSAVTVTGTNIPDLAGTITIDKSSAETGDELTATYSGSETVSFLWKKDRFDVGTASTTNPNMYTPAEAGSYTVTVSAEGYQSKTSSVVTVTGDYVNVLTGTVTINGTVQVYQVLNPSIDSNAYGTWGPNYKYQWKRGTTNIENATLNTYRIQPEDVGHTIRLTVTVDDYASSITSEPTEIVPIPLGITWTTVSDTKFGDSRVLAVAYGNGRFVAVGYHGKRSYSTDDGKTWVAATMDQIFDKEYSVDQMIYGIAYGSDKFVAVGFSGIMAYSEDGDTWTAVTDSPFSNDINDIAYGDGKFVAVSDQGKMAYSTDGITWTPVMDSTFGSQFNYSFINAITYGNDKFVAVGNCGKMAYSTDGIEWTAVTDSKFGNTLTTIDSIRYITYGGGKFIAVNANKIVSSTDGITWTNVTPNFGYSYYDVVYGNDRFILSAGSGRMAYSMDGVNWLTDNRSNFTYPIIAAYGNGKFIAISSGGIAYSPADL